MQSTNSPLFAPPEACSRIRFGGAPAPGNARPRATRLLREAGAPGFQALSPGFWFPPVPYFRSIRRAMAKAISIACS